MTEDSFETYRPKLFGIAYRMLGEVAAAEDAVQDTYVRWSQSAANSVDNIEAYLVTIITRLCIDNLKSARARRESYVGPWLPEPLIGDPTPGPDAQQELAESLSYAFMLLLEELSPVERAVYILREAFDFKHQEIAEVLGRSSAYSRQVSRRAHARLQQPGKRFVASDADKDQLFEQFVVAAASPDLQPLFEFLADDIVARTDGGGKVRAALKVLSGKTRVIEFIRRVLPQLATDSELVACRVNGQPAIKQLIDGKTVGLVTVHIAQGKVQQLFVVRNPDKLTGDSNKILL